MLLHFSSYQNITKLLINFNWNECTTVTAIDWRGKIHLDHRPYIHNQMEINCTECSNKAYKLHGQWKMDQSKNYHYVCGERADTQPPLLAFLYELNKNQRNVVVLRECNGKSPKEVNRPIHIILNSPKTARMWSDPLTPLVSQCHAREMAISNTRNYLRSNKCTKLQNCVPL